MANDQDQERFEQDAEPEGERTVAEETPQAPGGPPEDAGTRALSDALRVSFRFLKFAMVAVIVIYFLTGIFYVEPGNVSVKLRFGRPVTVRLGGGRGKGYVMDSESGWHIRWPWEEVVSIPTGVQEMELDREFWYGSLEAMSEMEKRVRADLGRTGARRMEKLPGLHVKLDGYLVTGDVNIVHVKLRVRYRALTDEDSVLDYVFCHESDKDPVTGKYPFPSSPRDLLKRFVVQGAIETVGSWAVMDVMTERKAELLLGIRQSVEKSLAEFKDESGMSAGVAVVAIDYTNEPVMPEEVRDSYHRAMQAASEMGSLIADAQTVRQRILGLAEGGAAEIVNEAKTYSDKLVILARADAEALTKLLDEYGATSEVAGIFRHWFYYRAIEKVFGEADRPFIVHKPEGGKQREMRYMYSRPPKRLKGPEQENREGR